MGAGEYSAGEFDLAGEDPLPNVSPPRDVSPPAALLFDGRTRTFPLDANGRYQDIHPTDQKVALALLQTLGSVPAVPELGSGLRLLRKITKKTPAEVRNVVALALAAVVNAREIEVRKVDVETKGAPVNAILIAVSYVNLLLPRSSPGAFEPRTVTITA